MKMFLYSRDGKENAQGTTSF